MYNIMIIEDDFALTEEIDKIIKKWGWTTTLTYEFHNILDVFKKNNPHLLIIDINLPLYDGFHWCREIRNISNVPILFLSSRESDMDIIMAVNIGADDYMKKPFSGELLAAKISSMLRRAYSFNGFSEKLEYKGLILDVSNNTIEFNQQKLELSKNEFKILNILIKNKNKIVSREEIMRYLWEHESFIEDNTLTVNINRLRCRLKEINLETMIKTKKGVGYIVE